MFTLKNLKLTYTQVIAIGFLVIILFGAFLLSMPFSSRTGEATPFINALFAATTSTCVTGLVVYDTYTHWSIVGQIIILSLIQIGGIGFMSVFSLIAMALKRRIGLKERRLLMESANTMNIGGVVALMKKILIGTFFIESLGAIALSIRFIPEMGLGVGIYNGIFHSVSAFCNAGIDIMGKYGQFTSLTRYSNDVIVNITIMLLIIIGGIGFIVWNDISKNGIHFSKYQLHTKIVLTTTFTLVFGGAILFYLLERNNQLAGMGIKETILASLFQSVTPRTAGFNTVDIGGLTEGGSLLTIILMFIGGSPGSTAGGIKTTTLVVLLLGVIASSRNTSDLTIFKRRLEDHTHRKASSILTIYISAVLISTMIICAMQPFTLGQVLMEVVSAIGTVGLTAGITPTLNTLSKLIIILLMYGGRVGGLSLALVLAEKKEIIPTQRPVEKIIIG